MGQHIFSSTDDRHQSITLRVYLVVYNELRVTQRVARVRLRQLSDSCTTITTRPTTGSIMAYVLVPSRVMPRGTDFECQSRSAVMK